MCVLCDGDTVDELRFRIHGNIARVGWSLIAIEPTSDSPPWAYTIGLSASFDAPELVVVGVDDDQEAARLLVGMSRQVRDYGPYRDGQHLHFPGGWYGEFLAVHPQQFDNRVFSYWLDYYEALGPPLPPKRALQLVLPLGSDVRLDVPDNVLKAGRLHPAHRRHHPRRPPRPQDPRGRRRRR